MQEKKETPYQKFIRAEQEKCDFASTKKSEIKKEISQRWKNLSDAEKEKYGLVKKKKKTSPKKTGFDFFFEEVVKDLENDDGDTTDARANIASLWVALGPDAKQKYEDMAAPPKKRKTAEKPIAAPVAKKANKGKTRVPFDFYLEEKKSELHQKASDFGFSADQVLFMAMMTFENLPPSERQIYIDMAKKPEVPEPAATEVYMIIDDDDEIPAVKKEKNPSPIETSPPAVTSSPPRAPIEKSSSPIEKSSPPPVEKSSPPVPVEQVEFVEYPYDEPDFEPFDSDAVETVLEKFESCQSDPEKLIELFKTDIDDAISAYRTSPPADKLFPMKQMIHQLEKKYYFPQGKIYGTHGIQKIFKNYVASILMKN